MHAQRPSVLGMLFAVLVLGANVGPVAADATYVNVTDIRFDKIAYLCGETTAAGCVRLSGTITCDATGLAELVSTVLDQRGVTGYDNLDLLDFACSTQPRAFVTFVETGGCDAPANFAGCFRPGRAVVRSSVVDPGLLTARTVVIRRSP